VFALSVPLSAGEVSRWRQLTLIDFKAACTPQNFKFAAAHGT